MNKFIIKICLLLLGNFFKIFPVDEKKIILVDGMNSYFDFFSIINMLKSKSDKKIIWLATTSIDNITIEKINKINLRSIQFLYLLSTSKYIFSNNALFSFYPLRKKQKNIQLWHGAGAFKQFYINPQNLLLSKRNYDLLTVSSNSIIDIYANVFRISKEKVKNLGIPRADIFFEEEEKQRTKEEFYKKYPELKNKKIILYAPTFRDNEKNKFNLKLDIEIMKKNLERLDYILLLKLHPGIKSKDIQVDDKFSYNFSDYSNTADLLIISDILISDYSSIIFEFSIMKKPILFYAYDVEEYIKDRGFYYNYYDFIPNKISYTTEEIIKAIMNQEWDLERIEKFARYFFNPFDGNSTERVLKEVGLWEENR